MDLSTFLYLLIGLVYAYFRYSGDKTGRPTRPATGGPTAGGPRTDGPAAGGPRADGPTAGGPRADGPTAGGPRADGPTAGGPRADGPRASGPRTDGPDSPQTRTLPTLPYRGTAAAKPTKAKNPSPTPFLPGEYLPAYRSTPGPRAPIASGPKPHGKAAQTDPALNPTLAPAFAPPTREDWRRAVVLSTLLEPRYDR